jgi:hypothetical protein
VEHGRSFFPKIPMVNGRSHLSRKKQRDPTETAVRLKHGVRFAADGWIYWESSFLQSKINDEGEEAIES